LDDALHIKRIKGENGEEDCWEVGVHIADVAYFLPIDTEVNSWARSRGTTVYLVHKVFFLNYSFVDIKRHRGGSKLLEKSSSSSLTSTDTGEP